jgi:hypothetical protein
MRKIKYTLLLSCLIGITGKDAFAQPVQTLIRTVNKVQDDAEQTIPGGTGVIGKMNLGSSDFDICTDGTDKLMMGIRFENIPIPPQAVIQSAYIQFTTKGDSYPVAGDVYITLEASDSAAEFVNIPFNMSSRPMVADSVLWPGSNSSTWQNISGGTAGPDQKTTNFGSILQQVINRPGWQGGNSIVVLMKGEGARSAFTYNGSSIYAPKLIIQYEGYPSPMPVSNFPVSKLSQWRYLDDGSDLGTAWTDPNFNDSMWNYGPGKLGYNDNAASILSYGPNAANKYITSYFRKKINIPSVAALTDTLVLSLLRDDGAVVYINGTEVVRSNMPAGTISNSTRALDDVDGTNEAAYFSYYVPRNLLTDGINTIAAEVHQKDSTSNDLGFDLDLRERALPALIRGPYLQMATGQSMNIRWRTDEPSLGIVHYGTTAAALNQTVAGTGLTTEHELKLTGLSPYTKYYYSIGSSSGVLQGDTTNYFYTLPVAGNTDSLYRIGVIGDCGNNSINQRNVRDQLAAYMNTDYMNAWILLGDNAYNTGTDAEYQAEFFNIYKDGFLKQSPLFPAPGNHDYGNSQSSPSVGNHILAPYYQNFSMPTHGESGGVASNSEAFYSFDIGNVHFLSLDSYGKEDNATTRLYDTTGAQVQWVKQDLEANTNKDWIVAYWHHPPYTMGSHNSDYEDELVRIRQNFIQILERYGVDLILCGHSHDYERSKLMKGNYGPEASFDATVHNLSQSSGLYNGSTNSCPYIKDAATNYEGTVYVVSGSAGQLGGEQPTFPHDALPYSNSTEGGSMILEVKGNRLDAKFICADGVIRDKFTMMKDVNTRKIENINAGQAITLTASYNSDYIWQGIGSTDKTVSVSPSDTTVYTVSDANNCLTDTFIVNVIGAPLPLDWGYIKAMHKDAHSNLIEWQTLQERNTHYFEIERSENGNSYTNIGRVNASGNANSPVIYTYTDKTISDAVPVYYYRIRQTDADGRFTYSSVVRVAGDHSAGNPEVVIAPNPAQSQEMRISVTGGKEVAATIVLTDISGKTISTRQLRLTNQPQVFLPEVKSGVYLLSVTSEGNASVRKIVIQ